MRSILRGGLLVVLCLPVAGSAVAQEPAAPPAAERAAGDREAEEAAGDEEAATPPEPAPPTAEAEAAPDADAARLDPCKVASPPEEPRLDQLRREMFETVCASARWFDGFFGSRRYDDEARKTHGRAQLRVVYDEHDELEVDGRFRARYELPNLDSRVNAFLGRDDEEELLTGTEDSSDFLPDFFRGEGRQEWIVGLGYRPVSSDRSQTDFDVGVEVRTPLEPFVRGRYRHYWLVGDRNLLRAQQSLYWTSQRGAGGTTSVEFERPIGRQALVRWGNRGTLDEESEGVDWSTGLTLYHGFGPDQAVALSLGAEGETDHLVPLREYGSRLTYRRRMLRDWFFGELIGGVSWPREEVGQERETAWHFGFGFELQFSGEDLGAGRAP